MRTHLSRLCVVFEVQLQILIFIFLKNRCDNFFKIILTNRNTIRKENIFFIHYCTEVFF